MAEKLPILCVSDGRSVRLYGDRSTFSVHVVEAATMDSVEGELLAEALLDEQLPWRFRELFFPGNQLATVTPRELRPSELVTEDCDRELLQSVKRMVGEHRSGVSR